MTRTGAARAARAALAPRLAAALLAAVAGIAGLALGTDRAAAQTGRSGGVSVRVVDLSPSTPARSAAKRPLLVTLDLTNTTGAALHDVRIVGRRGDPLTTQARLDQLLAARTPTPSGIDIPTAKPVRIDLPADGVAHRVVFRSTYGVPSGSGVCQCADRGVYPLFFTAEHADDAGIVKDLDTAVTFLPSFLVRPKPVGVSWVWPLIDRPHRLSGSTVFTDDALATEVNPGGRLDRALATVEQVADQVPLTLVVDPELLDELEVMAAGKYTVDTGSAAPVPGTGAGAARTWLNRFTGVLDGHPEVAVGFTPYADPDIPSLSLQNLRWRTAMPTDMTARVRSALGGRALDYRLGWPASGAYTRRSLATLAGSGTRSVLLSSTDVTPRDGAGGGVVSGIAAVRSGGHTLTAGLLDPALQGDVAASLDVSAPSATRLPALLSGIAIRAAEQPQDTHTVVLTPPRYVDTDPDTAAHVITATSRSPFSAPIALADALSPTRRPDTHSSLVAFPSTTRTLPSQITSSAADTTSTLPAVDSMLSGVGRAASGAAAELPVALQRTESSYWLSHPGTGKAFADALNRRVHDLADGVRIVPPSSGVYTLASSNARMPVTVENKLNYPVQVRVRVHTDNGLPGFAARDIGAQRIEAHARRTLHLPTSIARSGRIQIEAQLLSPKRQTLGGPVSLTVHSTAFGVIGIIITVVAGAVLAVALLVRLARRLLARRRRPGTPAVPPSAERAASPGAAA